MPVMLIRHTVADVGAWTAEFDEHELTRRAHGPWAGGCFAAPTIRTRSWPCSRGTTSSGRVSLPTPSVGARR